MIIGYCKLLVLLSFLTVFPLGSQSQAQGPGSLDLQLKPYANNFARPGEACDDEQALMKYNELISKHGTFEMAQQSEPASLIALSKLHCAFSSSFEIICQNKKCECADAKKQYFPGQSPETCRFPLGESCVSGEECPNHLICSNDVDLSRLNMIRPGPYQWKFNADCIRDCLDRLCAREAPNCSLTFQNCLVVTDCLQDPFEVPYQCIGECSNCPIDSDESDFAIPELCENNCRIERDDYTRNLFQRDCYAKCQRSPVGQQCFRNCSIDDFALTARQRREACPAHEGLKRTGCTNCVWDSITDPVYEQIRRKCLDDCPSNNITTCNTNCYEHCIRERSIEAELGCFFQCGVPSSRNPLCFANCVINVARSGALQSCKKNCEALPTNTQCDRCERACKRRTQSEFQLGRSELPQVVHCNRMCEIPQLDCNTCASYFLQQEGRCVSNCKRGNCQSKCMGACANNLNRTREGECYNECFQKIDSLQCLATCSDKFKNEPPDQVCMTECTNSPSTGDCTSCENNCKTTKEKLLKSYCLPDKKVCRTISKCETCTVEVANTCKAHCRPSGVSETPERCRTQCLDVCEPIRDYLIANHGSSGRYIPSCEIFCAQSAITKCLARCENFCDKAAPLICNCSPDGENHFDGDVNDIVVLAPDACRNCRRGLKRLEQEKCRVDCVPTAALDPIGVLCLTQCLDYCEKAEWFRHQVSCAESCKKNMVGCGGSEQVCLDKAIDHFKIRSRCFDRCYNSPFDPRHFVCFPQRCQDQCAEKLGISAPVRCRRPTPTAICNDTGLEPVVASTPKLSTCPNCTIKVRLHHLDVCRRTCEIINTDGQLADVNKFCTERCHLTCLTRLYWNQYKTCQDSSPNDVTKCVDEAVPDIKRQCTTTECPTTNLPAGLSIGQCPNCIDHCYKHEFFESAARVTCNPCTPQSQSQSKQTAIACDICKAVRVESICENPPPGCSVEKDCIDKSVLTCSGKCSEPKIPPEPSCREVCGRPNSVSTDPNCNSECRARRQNVTDTCTNACESAPTPTECQNVCTKEDCRKDLTAEFCERDCSGTIPELGIVSRRRRQVTPPRPTRKPGTDNFEPHWCCFDNGEGRCNSSNPRQLGITAKPNSAICLCLQEIIMKVMALVGITFLVTHYG